MTSRGKRPPRVGILTETYHPVVGGGERQAQALARYLVANGLGAIVVARRSSIDLARTETIDGIRVHRIPPSGAGPSRRWLMLGWSFMALLRL
jgi:hypothetical protein